MKGRIFDKFNGGLAVAEESDWIVENERRVEFREEVANPDRFLRSVRDTNVLGLRAGKSDYRLLLG